MKLAIFPLYFLPKYSKVGKEVTLSHLYWSEWNCDFCNKVTLPHDQHEQTHANVRWDLPLLICCSNLERLFHQDEHLFNVYTFLEWMYWVAWWSRFIFDLPYPHWVCLGPANETCRTHGMFHIWPLDLWHQRLTLKGSLSTTWGQL